MTDREELNFTLCMALRKVPPAIFRDMGKRRVPGDDFPEKMAAEKILAHLELTGLELTRKPRSTPSGGHSTP